MIQEHYNRWVRYITQHVNHNCELVFHAERSNIGTLTKSGWWDFAHRILTPDVVASLTSPYTSDALEIGYGGGRLLLPACNFFKHVHGIDVHHESEYVANMLHAQNIHNFSLHQNSGSTIPLKNNSVSFVYSYIVWQHFPSIETAKAYTVEMERVMKPGAVAIIYVGALLPKVHKDRDYVDLTTEKLLGVAQVTLRMRLPVLTGMMQKAKFDIIKSGAGYKKPWETVWKPLYFVVARKR